MKKIRSVTAMFMALLLVCLVPFTLDVMQSGLAKPDGGLNGSSGKWADFDDSVYDSVTGHFELINKRYQWPSSGSVLVVQQGSRYALADFNGFTIPAGLTVDIYKWYKSSGMTEPGYELLGHFDTTNGKPYVIGSDTSAGVTTVPGTNANGSNGTSNTGDSGETYNGKPKWGKVRNVVTPGKPSASYKNSYVDVGPGDWYYDAVMTMTDNGLLGGYGGGKFGPNDQLTRAQLAFVMTNLKGRTANVNSCINGYSRYKDETLADRGFAACVLGGFMNNTACRQCCLTPYEMTLVSDSIGLTSDDTYKNGMYHGTYDTWRGSLGKGIEYRSSIDQFPDADKIHAWIEENADAVHHAISMWDYSRDARIKVVEHYFLAAYNLGMFSGVDAEGNFNPYGPITRGQLSQALYSVGWTYKGVLHYEY